MTVLLVAIAFALLLAGLSVRANGRFRHERNLPMQWSLSGSVNWSAPRVFALSFTPILAATALTLFVALSMTLTPRLGQEGAVVPALIGLGGAFVAAHVFHLWLIERTLARNRG